MQDMQYHASQCCIILLVLLLVIIQHLLTGITGLTTGS